jgi:co-chaperonin GroES (HSP10)
MEVPKELNMMATDDRMAKAEPFIRPLLDAWDKNKPCVVLRDKIRDLLLAFDLAYTTVINSMSIGCHPKNRSGGMVDPDKVHARVGELHHVGFSESEMWDASCTEREPGAYGDECEKRNIDLAKNSHGLLPPIAPDSLNYFSMTCGHTSYSFRLARQGANSSCPEVSVNNSISVAKITESQPAWANAINNGISWFVVRWQPAKHWPEIVDLFQEAGNCTQQIARVESTEQLILKVHNAACAMGAEIDWSVVEAKVLRSNPRAKDQITDLISFCRAWSGGATGWLMKDLMSFLKTVPTVKVVPSNIYGKLAAVDLGGVGKGGFVVVAYLKAAHACSAKYIVNGESIFIKQCDVVAMTGRHLKYVLQANDIMATARTLTNIVSGKVDSAVTMLLISNLDVDLVCHILQRYDTGREKYDSLGSIGYAFYHALADCSKDSSVTLPSCPWPKPPPAAMQLHKPAKAPKSLTEINTSTGAVQDLVIKMAQNGIIVGSAVKDKAGNVSTIVAMSNTEVELQKSDSTKVKVDAQLFVKEFSKSKLDPEDLPYSTCTNACTQGMITNS